jgi:hypothetical protein
MGGWRMKRFAIVAIIAVILAIPVIRFFTEFGAATADVTDPSRYSEILNQLKGKMLDGQRGLSSFPAAIPGDAKNVRFFYRPHFSQGGTILQISYCLPDAEIESMISSPPCATTQPAGDNAGIPGNVSFWVTETASTDPGPLPEDFKAYVIDAKWPLSPADIDEGYCYGLAISLARHRVVYWAGN